MNRWLLALLSGAVYAQVTPEFFATKVYPVLENAQCRGCHSRSGVASGTRLHFPEKEANAKQIQSFGLGLAELVDRASPSNSLLLAKPLQRVKHTGGERIAPGSDEAKVLSGWVNYLATARPETLASARRQLADGAAARSTQLVRRLTHSQYNNTIRDLLGDPSKPAQRFPPEDFVDGFKNQLRNQGMPPLLVETYSTAAEKVALNTFRSGDRNGVIPCKPATATDEKCRDQFIRSFGLRAFRRPLNAAELTRYAAAFNAEARAKGQFNEGARTVVEAMLQSPKFLFHVEAGPDGQFPDYAIAGKLSYFLWDSMPDQMLLNSAAKGELRTQAGREKAARRLLESPQSSQALDEFFSQWLRFDRILNASKERRRFPEFSPELAAAMVEETRLLLHHLVSTNANFLDFLSADYGFVNSDLATLYGLPAPSSQFALLQFPAGTRRAGLLGHASFLASTAGPVETSPTARGIFVREQLLCQHVPPPPPNVNTNLPEPTEDKPLTHRQRLAVHVESPACSSCHKLMDPIGFGLEHFDALGRWRERELILAGGSEDRRVAPKRFELPLETDGEIAGLANSSFSDARQLGRILAQSSVCQECVVRQIFRYAHGRMETEADQPLLGRYLASFRDSGFRFRSLLLAVASSPEFAGEFGR